MANEYEKIERVAWGTGYREDYCTDGSWDAAKQKVRDLLTNETLIYVDSSVIHQKDWEHYISADWCWCFGYRAYAVPTKLALQCLNEYQRDYFSGFYLRDTLPWRIKNPQYFGAHTSNARYLLHFDGNFGTDHCCD
jgi:hypothetical protein